MTSLPPQKAREVLFLLVYALDLSSPEEHQEMLNVIMQELKVARGATKALYDRAMQLVMKKELLDRMIGEALVGYSVERLQTVEKAILRVLAFEMVEEAVDERLPPKVSIAEGKRLAKKFATPAAMSLVHAVLASIANKHGLLGAEEELIAKNMAADALRLAEREEGEAQIVHDEIRDADKKGE